MSLDILVEGQVVHIQKANEFVSWCRYDMIPLWAGIGWDGKYGGFFEDMHLDGSPDRTVNRRVRVTSRQVYAFAHASRLGWFDGRELVAKGIEWLLDKGRGKDGGPGFTHLVDDAGNEVNNKRDLYDHAFHILGFANAARATGDSQILALARQTLDFVEDALGSSSDVGWQEDTEGTLPRRQNPHMHMTEALIAMYQATEDAAYLRRAGEIISLLQERWVDPTSNTLLEFFDTEWNPVDPRTPEPGHMVEWCWLELSLRRCGAHISTDLSLWPDLAARLGSSQAGLLLDAITTDGMPASDTSRLWAQTEWLKSLCALQDAGTARTAAQMETVAGRIFKHYLILEPAGLWIDKVDRDGNPLSTRVPASIVYHLFSAAAEVHRVFNSQNQGKTTS